MPRPRAPAVSSKQFVFDDQLHFVRDDYKWDGIADLAKYAAAHWNPSMQNDAVGLGVDRYKFDNFLKEIYFDSDTRVGLLSGAPFDNPDNWFLTNDQIRQAADTVNTHRRPAAAAVPLAVHAEAAGLAGRGGSLHRDGAADQLEGLHDRRSAVAADHEISVAAGRCGR